MYVLTLTGRDVSMTVRGGVRMIDSTLRCPFSNRGAEILAPPHLGRDHTTNSSVRGPRPPCRDVPAIRSGNPYLSAQCRDHGRGLFPDCRIAFPHVTALIPPK